MNLLGLIILSFVYSAIGQNLRRGGRGGRGRDVYPKYRDNKHGDHQLFNALTISYPLHIFNPNEPNRLWRRAAAYSPEFEAVSTAERGYLEVTRAQDQEDVWLYENWFYGMKNGVIMESGALDGVLYSNSLMFESFANWTAIHVEADPSNYQRLKGNRERAINIHGALCSEPCLLHYSSLGVIPVRGFVELMSPSFLKKWHGPIYYNRTSIDELPTVQCLPTKVLFEELNVKHIDIWILDVEGAEESVLRGTDFNSVRINAVAMECDMHDNTKNERKTSILEANGFKCQLIERNCMCKNNAYEPREAKEKSIKWVNEGQQWRRIFPENFRPVKQ
eukprot:gene42130-51445_t